MDELYVEFQLKRRDGTVLVIQQFSALNEFHIVFPATLVSPSGELRSISFTPNAERCPAVAYIAPDHVL